MKKSGAFADTCSLRILPPQRSGLSATTAFWLVCHHSVLSATTAFWLVCHHSVLACLPPQRSGLSATTAFWLVCHHSVLACLPPQRSGLSATTAFWLHPSSASASKELTSSFSQGLGRANLDRLEAVRVVLVLLPQLSAWKRFCFAPAHLVHLLRSSNNGG
eukprot:g52717.t1